MAEETLLVYDILCERKQAEMCRTSGHGSKYIIVMIYEIILLVKYPCAGRRSNDYCYVALIFQSTPMVQIHVCMCITVGVTWALRECSDCLEIINNARLSLSRLLRVLGKERMLSQVSNKSITGLCCNSTQREDCRSWAADMSCILWLLLAVKTVNILYAYPYKSSWHNTVF